MGLFDGLGEYDDERRASVVRRQAELLDEQIAEKERLKERRGRTRRQDETAYLSDLFERDQGQTRGRNPSSRDASPTIRRGDTSSTTNQTRQPPVQLQIQLPSQLQPASGPVQPVYYQPQLWGSQPLTQQAFTQRLQQQLLVQPTIQLPSLLAQPLGEKQLPQLPPLRSARAKLQTLEPPDVVRPSPRPASLPPAPSGNIQSARSEAGLDGEPDSFKLRRDVPKPLAFTELFELGSERGELSQSRRRRSKLVDIDAEWKDYEARFPDRFKTSESEATPVEEVQDGSRVSAAASSDPSVTQPLRSPLVSSLLAERPSQSAILDDARGSSEAAPLPPAPLPPVPSIFVQPPVRSGRAASDDIRAMAASSLLEELNRARRSWADEREQLRFQSDSLKKQASRLRAEQVSLPSYVGRLQGFSQRSAHFQSEMVSARPPLSTHPRINSPPRLVLAQAPSGRRPEDSLLEPAPFARPRPPEAHWLLPVKGTSESGVFSPSLASVGAGIDHSQRLDQGAGAASLMLQSPAAANALLGGDSTNSGSALPEASNLLYSQPPEPKSASASSSKGSSISTKPIAQLPSIREEPMQRQGSVGEATQTVEESIAAQSHAKAPNSSDVGSGSASSGGIRLSGRASGLQSEAESQPAPQNQVLESTFLVPPKPGDRTLDSDFLDSLQYSDSSGGHISGNSATMRQRPVGGASDTQSQGLGHESSLNRVIDLRAELKQSGKLEGNSTSEETAKKTQEFLISALIKEEGSSAAPSGYGSSLPPRPGDRNVAKQTSNHSQGSTGGSSEEDPPPVPAVATALSQHASDVGTKM